MLTSLSCLSRGEIGLECFRLVVQDPRLAQIPLILETPTFEETSVWRREIEILYELQRVDGSPEEIAKKLEDMTNAWRTELAEMRRISGKGPKEKKAPVKKGKKGQQANDDQEGEEAEVEKPVKKAGKAKAKAAPKPKAAGKKRGKAVVDEELEHGDTSGTSDLSSAEEGSS